MMVWIPDGTAALLGKIQKIQERREKVKIHRSRIIAMAVAEYDQRLKRLRKRKS